MLNTNQNTKTGLSLEGLPIQEKPLELVKRNKPDSNDCANCSENRENASHQCHQHLHCHHQLNNENDYNYEDDDSSSDFNEVN